MLNATVDILVVMFVQQKINLVTSAHMNITFILNFSKEGCHRLVKKSSVRKTRNRDSVVPELMTPPFKISPSMCCDTNLISYIFNINIKTAITHVKMKATAKNLNLF